MTAAILTEWRTAPLQPEFLENKPTLQEMFELAKEGIGLNFADIGLKLSNRQDLHGMMLLDKLQPSQDADYQSMITCAEHDQIWYDIDLEKLWEVITQDEVNQLNACGIWYESENDSLTSYK